MMDPEVHKVLPNLAKNGTRTVQCGIHPDEIVVTISLDEFAEIIDSLDYARDHDDRMDDFDRDFNLGVRKRMKKREKNLRRKLREAGFEMVGGDETNI